MQTVRTITIEKKSVYGTELRYPICETAKLFASLVGRKTLTDSDIRLITALGYQVVRYYPPEDSSSG